jgi:hypothetical protein
MTDEKTQDGRSTIYIDEGGIPFKTKEVYIAKKKNEEEKSEALNQKENNPVFSAIKAQKKEDELKRRAEAKAKKVEAKTKKAEAYSDYVDAAEKNNNTSNKGTKTVKISDIDMPFGSMVVFMVKWAIASIPALIILMILFAIFGGFIMAIFN